MSNSKERGILNFFIFFDIKEKEYVGFCIDLGILKFGTDLEKMKSDLEEAAQGYVKNIGQYDLSDKLLNQHEVIPEEYRMYFDTYLKILTDRANKSYHKKFINTLHITEPQIFSTMAYA